MIHAVSITFSFPYFLDDGSHAMQCQEDPKTLNVGVYLGEVNGHLWLMFSNNNIMIVVHEHES